jgi:hypothetical protein
LVASVEKIAPPVLAAGDLDYSKDYQDKLNNIQRLFYNRFTQSYNNLLATDQGGRALYFPFGSFYDTTDQTVASTTTAYPITLNTTDFSEGVEIQSSSQIKVSYAGVYIFNISAQLSNTTNAAQDVDIWFRKNGTDIANSNTRFGLAPRKSAGDPFHTVAYMGLPIQLAIDDYVQFMWRSTDTGVIIEHYAAGTSPTRPAIPSVIAWVTFVSNV